MSESVSFNENKVNNPKFIAGLRDSLGCGGEGPSMIWLSGGEFKVDRDDSGPFKNEKQASITMHVEPFSIGQCPVTIGEYLRFCEKAGGHWPRWINHKKNGNDFYSKFGVTEEAIDLPVISITWNDASAYCQWISSETGEHYRLPTEAEWEYACRAGNNGKWCFGDDEGFLGDYAWYSENADKQIHPVGQKKPNAWGLYDMYGNAMEWCEDWYAGCVNYIHDRGVRSSTIDHPARFCYSAHSHRDNPLKNDNTFGIRIARDGPWHSCAGIDASPQEYGVQEKFVLTVQQLRLALIFATNGQIEETAYDRDQITISHGAIETGEEETLFIKKCARGKPGDRQPQHQESITVKFLSSLRNIMDFNQLCTEIKEFGIDVELVYEFEGHVFETGRYIFTNRYTLCKAFMKKNHEGADQCDDDGWRGWATVKTKYFFSMKIKKDPDTKINVARWCVAVITSNSSDYIEKSIIMEMDGIDTTTHSSASTLDI